jgi:hypothetical protein
VTDIAIENSLNKPNRPEIIPRRLGQCRKNGRNTNAIFAAGSAGRFSGMLDRGMSPHKIHKSRYRAQRYHRERLQSTTAIIDAYPRAIPAGFKGGVALALASWRRGAEGM